MLLDIAFLDDATRPPPIRLDGLTEAQKEPGRHLRAIHDHLRDNLNTLARLIERAAEGEARAQTVADEAGRLALVDNYRRFGALCGQHCQFVHMHHSIEDAAVFPALATHGDGFRAIADRLRAEHEVVHDLLVRLIEAIAVLAREPGAEAFATARGLHETLARVLLSHLGYEEEAIGDALGAFGIA